MNIVCYGHPSDKVFRDTWGKIQKTSPELRLELSRTLDCFTSRLREPGRRISAVILYIADKTKLSNLSEVRPLLNDLPIVILLNDQEPEILKFSHGLQPRFILYTDWRIKDICSVLQRCVSRYCSGDGTRIAAARD